MSISPCATTKMPPGSLSRLRAGARTGGDWYMCQNPTLRRTAYMCYDVSEGQFFRRGRFQGGNVITYNQNYDQEYIDDWDAPDYPVLSGAYRDCTFIGCVFGFGQRLVKGVSFKRCTFEQCRFDRAILRDVRFDDCTFYRCRFDRSKFDSVRVEFSTLVECSLRHAKIISTVLEFAALVGCDLTHAKLQTVTLYDVRLRHVNIDRIALDAVQWAPDEIGGPYQFSHVSTTITVWAENTFQDREEKRGGDK